MISREEALELVKAQNPEPHLVQHALASEAIMRALAAHFAESPENIEIWGITGLLHDLDFPQTRDTPEQHGLTSLALLEHVDVPDELRDAIAGHNFECNKRPCDTKLARSLRCAETVTGLIITAALVRPTRFDGLGAQSLKKKMKDKAFAASVNRERIRDCESIGLELGEFLDLGVAALAPIAAQIGVKA